MSAFDYIKENIIMTAPEVASKRPTSYLQEFVNLDSHLQHKVLNTLWIVFKNVIREKVEAGRPLVLPYIGTLRIKPIRQLALEIKQMVAEKYGYSDYGLLPRDLYEDAEKEVKQILYNKINDLRAKNIKWRTTESHLE